MSDSLNMTLDDIVKRSKIAKSGGKRSSHRGRGANGSVRAGRGAIRGAGSVSRGRLAVNARPSSFSMNKLARRKRSLPWQNDLLEESLRAVGVSSGVEVGTTVYVTNLDQGVTNEDIRELFTDVGELKRFAVHYDNNGRPSGTAEVVYMRRNDAFQAMKRYNNVALDGRPMKLEILGRNTEAGAPVNVTGVNRRLKRTAYKGGKGRGQGGRLTIQNQQGSGRGGRGGRGGGGQGRKKPSAAELDDDLECYHAEAMNIS